MLSVLYLYISEVSDNCFPEDTKNTVHFVKLITDLNTKPDK